MTESLTFDVIGDPKPQGSKRAFVPKGGTRPVLVESAGAPLKDWRASVTTHAVVAARATATPILGPVAVRLEFRLHRPKAAGPDDLPAKRPDVDKLVRAVLDGIVDAGVIADDGQVTDLHATKRYADGPLGCAVTLRWLAR